MDKVKKFIKVPKSKASKAEEVLLGIRKAKDGLGLIEYLVYRLTGEVKYSDFEGVRGLSEAKKESFSREVANLAKGAATLFNSKMNSVD